MEGIMVDFLHLNKLNQLIPPCCHVFVIKQSCLLDWNDLVNDRVHHQDSTSNTGDIIDIGKVILFKLDIPLILVIEHAGKRTDRTL